MPLVLERTFDPPTELEAARKRRAEAHAAYRDAVDRMDTRDLNKASRAFRAATTAVVRLEIGR